MSSSESQPSATGADAALLPRETVTVVWVGDAVSSGDAVSARPSRRARLDDGGTSSVVTR